MQMGRVFLSFRFPCSMFLKKEDTDKKYKEDLIQIIVCALVATFFHIVSKDGFIYQRVFYSRHFRFRSLIEILYPNKGLCVPCIL